MTVNAVFQCMALTVGWHKVHTCIHRNHLFCSFVSVSCYATDLPTWLRGLRLSELQCSEPGWLFWQGVDSSPAHAGMSSQVSACYVIISRAGTEGSSVSSLKCDRPSYPDWGRLGEVRAAGVDNRW